MSVILEVIAPRLLAPALMVAAAIIVKGYTDVGDGFSAGVIVALAIGLAYITRGAERTEERLPFLRRAPAIAAGGLLIALVVAFHGVLLGDPPLTHRPLPGEEVVKIGTLELITAVAFDLGLFLLVAGSLTTLIQTLRRMTAEADA